MDFINNHYKVAKKIIDENLSKGVDEPFYILNLEDVKRKYEIWREKIPRVVPHYAVKCNDDERVLKLLKDLGAGFDCASKKEFTQMLGFNIDRDRIIYAQTAKQVSYLKLAAVLGIDKMTFDCPAELYKMKEFHPNAKIVLRIRFDAENAFISLGSKFGCNPVTEAPNLIKLCKEMEMNLIGISFHVGSGSTDDVVFGKALDVVRKLFDYAETLDMKLNFVDIGGGFVGSDMEIFDSVAKNINSAIERNFPSKDIKIIAEPGRYFVDTAFSVAAQVVLKKEAEDGQIYYYINESTYLSFTYYTDNDRLKFSIVRNSNSKKNTKKLLSTIWGCTCSSLDKIYSDIMFPELDEGDWLVFHEMGAYSTATASEFNGFSNKTIHLFEDYLDNKASYFSEKSFDRLNEIEQKFLSIVK